MSYNHYDITQRSYLPIPKSMQGSNVPDFIRKKADRSTRSATSSKSRDRDWTRPTYTTQKTFQDVRKENKLIILTRTTIASTILAIIAFFITQTPLGPVLAGKLIELLKSLDFNKEEIRQQMEDMNIPPLLREDSNHEGSNKIDLLEKDPKEKIMVQPNRVKK